MRLSASALTLVCFLLLANTTLAQEQDRAPKRHSLVFDVGLLGSSSPGTDVRVGSAGVQTYAGGVSGGVHYDYRVSENWAATIRWAMLDSGAGVAVEDRAGFGSGASAGFALLFGAKYFPSIGDDLPLAPFFALATGPYMRTNSSVRIGRSGLSSGARSEQVLGLFGQVGADWHLNHWLKFQVGVGYHAVEAFDGVEGLTTNYSGADFSIGMGVRFGR